MAAIRLKLKTGECKSNSSLNRVLGQYQINTQKFCTQFNTESLKKYKNGILFYCYITKVNKDIFTIFLGSPCLKDLIINFSIFKNNSYYLTIEEFYDLFLIYKNLSNKNINLKNFLGSISTFKNLKLIK